MNKTSILIIEASIVICGIIGLIFMPHWIKWIYTAPIIVAGYYFFNILFD